MMKASGMAATRANKPARTSQVREPCPPCLVGFNPRFPKRWPCQAWEPCGTRGGACPKRGTPPPRCVPPAPAHGAPPTLRVLPRPAAGRTGVSAGSAVAATPRSGGEPAARGADAEATHGSERDDENGKQLREAGFRRRERSHRVSADAARLGWGRPSSPTGPAVSRAARTVGATGLAGGDGPARPTPQRDTTIVTRSRRRVRGKLTSSSRTARRQREAPEKTAPASALRTPSTLAGIAGSRGRATRSA